MISAISPRGELRFRVQEGKMNAGKFIDFLKALLDSVSGKVFLIVDGHPVHRAKKVSEFVEEKSDGRLSIFFLPPYSPDLNPDEWVWKNVKNDRIGRGVIMSAGDLKAKAIGALRRLQKRKYSEMVWWRAGYVASTRANANRTTGLPNTYGQC
jgi:transposase